MKSSDKADTGGSNRVGITIGPHFEDRVIDRVERKVDTGNS